MYTQKNSVAENVIGLSKAYEVNSIKCKIQITIEFVLYSPIQNLHQNRKSENKILPLQIHVFCVLLH